MLVADIVRRVRNQYGDVAGIQLTDQVLFDWINDAQRELVLANNLLHKKATAVSVAGQAQYPLPPEMLKLVSVYYNNVQVMYNPSPEVPGITEMGDPVYYTVYSDALSFIPIPGAANQTIQILYSRRPVEISALDDTLEIPDQYQNRVLEYCIAKSAEFDENPNKYEQKMREFTTNTVNMLDGETEEPNDVYPYPTVTADAHGWLY